MVSSTFPRRNIHFIRIASAYVATKGTTSMSGAVTVGTLKISLVAGTAAFQSDMQGAAGTAKKTAGQIRSEFDRVDFGEARGSLSLFSEQIGVALPRHLQTALAKIPGLQTALAGAFPAIAAVALFEAIGKGVEKLEEMRRKSEEMREENIKVASAWQDAGTQIRGELDKQHEKIIGLTQGPIAAMEYAINHLGTSAVAAFRTISAEIIASERALDKGKGLFNAFGTASDDLKKFQADLDDTIHKAAALSPTNPFAGYAEGITLAEAKLKEAKQHITELQEGIGGKAKIKGADLTRLSEPWNKEIEAIQNTITILSQYKAVQAATIAANALDLGAKRTDEVSKQWNAEKSVLDARTKTTIAGYELEFAQGKITAEKLAKLKQSAIDADYSAQVAYFERLKVLDAKRPEQLKQVLAQESTLEANHATEIIASYTKALDAQIKGIAELDKINTEQSNAGIAAQTKESEATFKGAAIRAMALVNDSNLIQAQGNKKVAAIDLEIRNLERLKTQYQLTGKAKEDVDNAIHKLAMQRQADLIAELLGSAKLGDVMHGTLLKIANDGKQWHTKMATEFEQSIAGMNSSLAQFITTGKGSFASLAQNAISSFIQIGLQYAESKLEMALLDKVFGAEKGVTNTVMAQSDAALAAAGTFAYYSAIFPPIAPAMATVAYAEGSAWAAAAAFERGGEVPDGFGPTPAMLHPREMVLPAHLADVVRSAAANNGGGSGISGNAQHIHYSPHVAVPPGGEKQFAALLDSHFDRWTRSQMRKRYTRTQ